MWLVNGNDFIDAASGKKLGSLNLQGVLDQQMPAPNTLAFQVRTQDPTHNVVVAHVDEAAIRSAAEKAH
jgi:hypothetical protein